MEFTLRPWEPGDLENLVRFANNFKIAKNLTDKFPHPYTLEDGKAFLAMASEFNPPRIMAIVAEEGAIGSIGVFPQTDVHRFNAEMGYWLAEPYWSRGIMTRAIRLMVDYAFKTWEINRIFARPYGTNLASQKILEKNGFKREAFFEKTLVKNGELLDELIYAIRK